MDIQTSDILPLERKENQDNQQLLPKPFIRLSKQIKKEMKKQRLKEKRKFQFQQYKERKRAKTQIPKVGSPSESSSVKTEQPRSKEDEIKSRLGTAINGGGINVIVDLS